MSNTSNSLRNRLLIAMPSLADPFFNKAVVYIFEHSAEGAMGIVINRPMENVTIADIYEQLEIPLGDVEWGDMNALDGGPVAKEQGLIIHTHPDIGPGEIIDPDLNITLSASRDVLASFAETDNPRLLVSLGYSGWGGGQLEHELINNSWIIAPVQLEILYELDYEKRWRAAAELVGVDFDKMSDDVGHA